MGYISTIINGVKDVAFDKPWQKGFWYEQQEYNSPENQVNRMREAGINPALAIGNIQSGQGASIAPTNPNIASGVTDSILSIINNKKQQKILDAEAREKNANAFVQEINSFTKFAKDIQEIKESMSREDKNRMDEMMTNVLGTAEEQLKRSQTAVNSSQNEINWLNYAKGMQELKYLPTQQRLDYLERMAEIANIRQDTAESKQRVKKLIQETNHEFFKSKGQKFVNDLNEKTERWLIREREHKSRISSPFEFGDILNDTLNDWWSK